MLSLKNYHCPLIRFIWQSFGSGGPAQVASVGRHQELPPCWTDPVPASSRTDPPLVKIKPISYGGCSSVIRYLRNGKNHCAIAVRKK